MCADYFLGYAIRWPRLELPYCSLLLLPLLDVCGDIDITLHIISVVYEFMKLELALCERIAVLVVLIYAQCPEVCQHQRVGLAAALGHVRYILWAVAACVPPLACQFIVSTLAHVTDFQKRSYPSTWTDTEAIDSGAQRSVQCLPHSPPNLLIDYRVETGCLPNANSATSVIFSRPTNRAASHRNSSCYFATSGYTKISPAPQPRLRTTSVSSGTRCSDINPPES